MRVPTGTERIGTVQYPLSTTAQKIASISAGRHRALIRNHDAALVVYVGGANVSTSNGFLLDPKDAVPIYSKGEIWAVAASGTPTVSVLEED